MNASLQWRSVLQSVSASRLARLEVRIWNGDKPQPLASVRAVNVKKIDIDLSHPIAKLVANYLQRDDETLRLQTAGTERLERFQGRWRKTGVSQPRRYGPAIQILDGRARLAVVVGTLSDRDDLLSKAKRISHDAYVYGRIDVEIMLDTETHGIREKSILDSSHVVVVGGPADNEFARYVFSKSRSPGMFAGYLRRTDAIS
jgi:hypothetical protein